VVGMQTQVQVLIARTPQEVQAFVLDGRTLPAWSFNTAAEPSGDGWLVTSPLGQARLRFLDPDAPGVLDHDVEVAPGVVVHVPMRVRPHPAGSEVQITVLPAPGATEESFAEDVRTVEADLARLKDLLER
jgi:hypothetical protein